MGTIYRWRQMFAYCMQRVPTDSAQIFQVEVGLQYSRYQLIRRASIAATSGDRVPRDSGAGTFSGPPLKWNSLHTE